EEGHRATDLKGLLQGKALLTCASTALQYGRGGEPDGPAAVMSAALRPSPSPLCVRRYGHHSVVRYRAHSRSRRGRTSSGGPCSYSHPPAHRARDRHVSRPSASRLDYSGACPPRTTKVPG